MYNTLLYFLLWEINQTGYSTQWPVANCLSMASLMLKHLQCKVLTLFLLHSLQSEAKWKKVLMTSLSWDVDDFMHHSHKVQNVPWFWCFFFVLIFYLRSLCVVKLWYHWIIVLITYSVCLIQGCKIRIIVVWIVVYRETVLSLHILTSVCIFSTLFLNIF